MKTVFFFKKKLGFKDKRMADWKAARSTKVEQMLLKQEGLKIRIYATLTDVFPCNIFPLSSNFW